MEKTFLAIKPDAVQRGLIAEIISRIEKKGFKLVGLKMMIVSKELAAKHYAEHIGKPFFDNLVNFISSGPIIAMAWEGKNIVSSMRKLMGATNPANAEVGTIRGDLAIDMARNVIHGSDSVESAQRELALFFNKDELFSSWDRNNDEWIYE